MATFYVNEKTTAKYTAVLKDENGATVGSSDLVTLTLTLYNKADGTIINNRNAQNVLNANNVTVDANGNLAWTLQPADNIIVSDSSGINETHVALFEATYGVGGANAIRHQVEIVVNNLAKVT